VFLFEHHDIHGLGRGQFDPDAIALALPRQGPAQARHDLLDRQIRLHRQDDRPVFRFQKISKVVEGHGGLPVVFEEADLNGA